jgi:hypothetical protein
MPRRLAPAALVAFGLLALATAVRAQPPQNGGGQPRTIVTVPLQELPSGDTFAERAGRFWGDLLDFIGVGGSASGLAIAQGQLAREQAHRDDFTWLMDIAGYKLKEIESTVGLIPSLSLTFGQARELTESDREYVERQLERHTRRNPGPLSAIQRAIVRGVLDASELGDFAVEKVEVDLLPLPKVKFALTPIDAPLSLEASRILRAIDRLNARLQQIAPRAQNLDGPPAPGAPPQLVPVLVPAVLH